MWPAAVSLLFFDLSEFKIYWRGPPEDRDGDLDPRPGFVDFLHHAVEGGERPVRHPHVFTDLEPDRGFRPFDAVGHLALDPVGFDIGNRHRLLVRTKETSHLGRILDQVVDFVSEVAFDQDVAGEKFPLRVDLASAAHLDNLLGRYENLFEFLQEATLARLFANGFRHLLFEVGISVNDVPAHSHFWAIQNSRVSRHDRNRGLETRLCAAPRRQRGRTG